MKLPLNALMIIVDTILQRPLFLLSTFLLASYGKCHAVGDGVARGSYPVFASCIVVAVVQARKPEKGEKVGESGSSLQFARVSSAPHPNCPMVHT